MPMNGIVGFISDICLRDNVMDNVAHGAKKLMGEIVNGVDGSMSHSIEVLKSGHIF